MKIKAINEETGEALDFEGFPLPKSETGVYVFRTHVNARDLSRADEMLHAINQVGAAIRARTGAALVLILGGDDTIEALPKEALRRLVQGVATGEFKALEEAAPSARPPTNVILDPDDAAFYERMKKAPYHPIANPLGAKADEFGGSDRP